MPKFFEMLTNILLAVNLVVAVAILVVLVLIINRIGTNDKTGNVVKEFENRKEISYKAVLPLKIQACERMLLYLERIQFPMLVKRIYTPGMSVNALHVALNQNVREEFEHNMAQQLYVSPNTWQAVNAALDDVLRQINDTFGQLTTDSDSAAAAQQIIRLDNSAVASAIAHVKFEFDSL